MAGRRRFLDRTRTAQERRARDGRGFDPAGMIRLAGFGAALVVFIGVYIGFGRGTDTQFGGPWGAMHRLTQPFFFGANALELIALLIVALAAWRFWRRMKSG